jgi:MFS family permease
MGIASLLNFGVGALISTCAILYGISFLVLIGDFGVFGTTRKHKKSAPNSWLSILKVRDFQLYLLPWLLFNISAGLVSFFWLGIETDTAFEWVFEISTILRYIGAALFGLVSGFLADKIGRKKPIIVSLIILGLGFTLLAYGVTPETVFFYLLTSGFAWGILMVTYIALLGDLSKIHRSPEKFYALGAFVPLIIYMFLPPIPNILLSWPYEVPTGILSILLSSVLYLSILPIIYAGDTLSESKIHERKLREYAKKVGEMAHESKKSG